MTQTIYETNYRHLETLGVISDAGFVKLYQKSKAKGFMDLIVERLDHIQISDGGFVLSLAHYFEQNGDLCADPEMTVGVYPKAKAVEALSFQQAIPSIYQVVYPEPDKEYPTIKKNLNRFLGTWLSSLIQQGHGQKWFEKS